MSKLPSSRAGRFVSQPIALILGLEANTAGETQARGALVLAGKVPELLKGTPGKLVQELVDEAIDRYAELASVKKALEARREQVAADEGKLSHLRAKRGVTGATPDVPSS